MQSYSVRRNEVASRTSGVSQVLTGKAVGDTETLTPSNRISWVCRHPAVLETELVGPERCLNVTRGSGSDLAKGEKKMRVRTLVCSHDMREWNKGVR